MECFADIAAVIGFIVYVFQIIIGVLIGVIVEESLGVYHLRQSITLVFPIGYCYATSLLCVIYMTL